MTIGATELTAVIALGETTFPGAALTMYYGSGASRTSGVQVFRSDSTINNSTSDIDGVIIGVRGRLRLVLSRTAPWDPPEDRAIIDLFDADEVKIGTYTILSHIDDPTKSIRTLIYGEEEA